MDSFELAGSYQCSLCIYESEFLQRLVIHAKLHISLFKEVEELSDATLLVEAMCTPQEYLVPYRARDFAVIIVMLSDEEDTLI